MLLPVEAEGAAATDCETGLAPLQAFLDGPRANFSRALVHELANPVRKAPGGGYTWRRDSIVSSCSCGPSAKSPSFVLQKYACTSALHAS